MRVSRCLLVAGFLTFAGAATAEETWADAMKAYSLYRTLNKEGLYRGAIPYARRVVDLVRKLRGETDPQYPPSLENLAKLYRAIGEYDKALPLYTEALDIYKKAHDDTGPLVLFGLDNLWALYCDMGEWEKALALNMQALTICRVLFGDEHSEVATHLNNLGWLYSRMGEYDKALPIYAQALSMCKRLHGAEHRHVANVLNNLGSLYCNMGKNGKALSLLTQALAMRKRLLGQEHPDVTLTSENLATVYRASGDYGKALGLYTEVVAMRRAKRSGSFADAHPRVLVGLAGSLSKLADLYRAIGEYDKALPLFREALEIFRKTHRGEHPLMAATLNNATALYQAIGDYSKALSACTQALEMRRKLLGEGHPLVAQSLNSLAALYCAMGEHGKALRLYVQALGMRRGQDHPAEATTLNDLGLLYCATGEYVKAAESCIRALGISREAHGSGHPSVATSLHNLALIYIRMGDYVKAEPVCVESLEALKRAYGSAHPMVGTSLHNLGVLLAATERPRESLGMMTRAREIAEKETRMMLGFAPERTQLAFLRKMRFRSDILLSLVRAHFLSDARALTAVADATVRSKGLTLEAEGWRRDAVAACTDPEIRGVLSRLNGVRRRLARTTLAGSGGGAGAYAGCLADLQAEQDKLEARLSRLSADFSLARRTTNANAAAVADALPRGATLVDFVRPRIFDFRADGNQRGEQPARYLAFVIRQGGRAPSLVDLGNADRIERALERFRTAVEDGGAGVQTGGYAAADAKVREMARELYDLVFKAMEPVLGDVRRLFVCPEGQLSLLPFEAMCDEKGRYLVERYEFSYLTASRDLLRYSWPGPKGKGAVLLADPDFDLGRTRQLALARTLGERKTWVRGGRSRALTQLGFEALPGTRIEAETIAELVSNPVQHLGAQAIEGSLKAAHSPRIVHIATHGFFLQDQELSKGDAATRGLGGVSDIGDLAKLGASVELENPLLRSGLALAGANRWAEAAQAGDVDDGLLTALEVSALNLRGTELVVLSACETGVGEVKVGEGVFGLRRAFVAAGARSLITSLWKVPDAETVQLMGGFYRRWQSGKDKAVALRDTQLDLMRSLREKHGAAHPFLWAGFILVGDWRHHVPSAEGPVAHVSEPQGTDSPRPSPASKKLPFGFVMPTSGEDQYGNPVATRNGGRTDPATGCPYEIWLKQPRMEFVLVPSGEFMMGSPSNEVHRQSDEQQHRVRLTKPFYLGKYEVTQGQWSAVMGSCPWSGSEYVRSESRNPAVHISWDDCQGFLKKLDAGFRLPTEAEWEYACRAGSTGAYCASDETGRPGEYAWFHWNAGQSYAHGVGQKRSNAWGLYDMHGNVAEWCSDWYGEYPSRTVTDPTGALHGSYRVFRGGFLLNNAHHCRSASRTKFAPGVRDYSLGFRPSKSVLVSDSRHGTALSGPSVTLTLKADREEARRLEPIAVPILVIRSTPPDADVYVDGRKVGTTPLRWPMERRQRHEVRVVKAGYRAWSRTLVAPVSGVEGFDVVLDGSEQPPEIDHAFILPTSDRDQYGNPVVKRDGQQYDAATGYPCEIWLKRPRMEFVLVSAGDFVMGSDSGESTEGPAHKVRLAKPFYLAKYETTQGQWESVMNSRPWSGKDYVEVESRHPAVDVSWRDCQAFVGKLGAGFRLPTEAEWEYACRAGSARAYCFGDRVKEGGFLGMGAKSILGQYAWYGANAWDIGEKYAHGVGLKKPNAWGLYDMHGNVWEWCQDWYGEYVPGDVTDPTGPPRGSRRVYRGGGFSFGARNCRSTSRRKFGPDDHNLDLGCRPVRSLP